jgi:tetratricopeptide (TPR) repeat protein
VRFETLLRKLLDEAAPDALKIVLTVRADFEPQLDDGALKDLWMLGRCTVPPFSVEELKEAIVMPTMQEVLIFDPPELVDAIIEEVVQSPGALPLLSFTLSELYEAYRSSGRQDRALKKEDYDKLGGVMGALRAKADALYQQLDTKAQNTMRKIMLRMVSLEGELAGKRVALDELIFADTEENRHVQTVVDQLIEARLVVKGKDYIEPAHDALVRAWGTLHGWIHAVGEDKILLNAKLNAAANEYAKLRNVKLLWNANPHLSVLQSELRRPQQWFNEKETAFIRLSERRKKKLSRILRAVTISVIAALSALTIWAWLEQRRANGTINQARGFTDGLMFQIYDGLRSIAKTEGVRSDLLNKVGTLHSNLSQVGAGEDQSTLFWQSILQGDIQVERHELESARAKFAQAAKIAQGLSQSGNQDWQRNLSISFGKLGDLESGAGNVDAARTWYQRALDLDKRLAAHDADNRIWQRDLLVSYVKLAELEERSQRFDAARTLYQQSGSLAERLAKNASDAQAQHDLFVNHVRRGELEERVERLEQARAMYEAARRFAESMPKEDPQAARDLLIGLVRLGDLAYKEDRLSAARELYNEVMANAQRLTEAELGDSAMQHELFKSYKRLAELKAEAFELEDARNAADRAWNIAKRQTAINPTDNQWQKYHFMVLIQLGEIEAQDNALAEARNRFNQALELASTEEERQSVLASIAALDGAR